MYDEYKVPQTIARSIAWDVFRVKKGLLTSRYIQLYLCFAMSGFFHWMAAKLAYPEKTFYNTFAGFIWQASGIVIEDFAIWAGRKAGFTSPNWKYLGYVWFLVFISWSAPLYFDDCVEGGWLRPETWPVSLIHGVWKGEWKANTV
ncbi:hypothetical protein EWM64_g10303 [Hericium alpestre]|uniref:Wax synthase domain-containing protein n=1 Tax=Hericium alpestre TaxID=135208 RepID=A0A4Y9ZJU9_9AGAM|nr:hypothetical protein EWM64_g10303 [Hericium alpestre]